MNAKELTERYKNGERDFRGICLSGENLAWATLAQVDLRASNLQESNLSGANLQGANLSENTNLMFANLSRSDLSGTDLSDANLIGASLDSAKLEDAIYNLNTKFPQGFDCSQIICPGNHEYHQESVSNVNIRTQNRKLILKNSQEFESLLDVSSKRYGRLLNWQYKLDPFWNYGIGLSDSYIFDTGKGLQPFQRQEAEFVKNIESIKFSPQKTIDRLKEAIFVFSSWNYSSLGWNCEHLARLIATDEPRSYQRKIVWWISDLTPDGDHKTARQVFRDHLAKYAPHLNR